MLSMESRDATLFAGAALAAYVVHRYWRTFNRPPLPPGPVPLPLIGNILDMPKTRAPLAFSALGDKYGPVTFIRVPGANILVINSYDTACELLDKRGTLYVDRPRKEMMGELIGMRAHSTIPLKELVRELTIRTQVAIKGLLFGVTITAGSYSESIFVKVSFRTAFDKITPKD
ncbi:hypothetical protein FRB90_006994 [Tulasnella sp. 427]|nr:hypothetical protein FRB90_006994 [Tulasnella sp. 427]